MALKQFYNIDNKLRNFLWMKTTLLSFHFTAKIGQDTGESKTAQPIPIKKIHWAIPGLFIIFLAQKCSNKWQ